MEPPMSDRNANLVYGLEREFFVGDALFERETEKIFSRNWLCVGRVEDFGNNGAECFRTIRIGDYDLIVARRDDGTFAAFHNVCRHRGTRLIDTECGPIKNSCLTCPYHAWTYDLDGALIGAPNMNELDEFQREEHGLIKVATEIWDGFVMVHLDANANLENDFAPIIERIKPWNMQELVLGATLNYDVAANWKIVFQNYSECYHCPTVHPNLNRLTPYRGATNDLLEGAILGGPMGLSDGSETVSTDGKKISEPFSGLSSEQRRCVYYYTLFPNMFVSAHPDYVMVHHLDRIDSSNTRLVCYFLVAKGTESADVSRAVEQWDEVNRQDWQVCELTQKGIQSPIYRPGPYSNLEPMLIAFDKHYRMAMK